MRTAARLGLYGGALALVFAGAAAAGAAVVPDHTVADWTQSQEGKDMDHQEGKDMDHAGGHPEGHGGQAQTAAGAGHGLAVEQDGYLLSPVTAPGRPGTSGRLAFQVLARDGSPLRAYRESHDQQLHLIVVRSDGTLFRHVHPTLGSDGVWSMPWSWAAAGTYRVYADFVPDVAGAPDLTLSRTLDVAGELVPAPPTQVSRTSAVDGFDVTLDGDLRVGTDTGLTATVTRDGEPVTTLQPYLGAFGHLVVLRVGDLAYLHVHPMGDEPDPGATSGPSIAFMSSAPTAGRYLLYLDFQVDDQVHTATFTLDAA